MSPRSATADQSGSPIGTQMIFASGPFSSTMWNTAMGRADPAAGKGRVADEDERIERVAVFPERPFDEPVVRRVGHRREQATVERDAAELVVVLVLVARTCGDLDVGDRDRVVVRHRATLTLSRRTTRPPATRSTRYVPDGSRPTRRSSGSRTVALLVGAVRRPPWYQETVTGAAVGCDASWNVAQASRAP